MDTLNQGLILLPVFALGSWTMIILLLIAFRRLSAVYRGEINFEDFALGESNKVATYITLANRNFINLLEFPILFYVACLMFYILKATTDMILILSWLYVGLRVCHSLIHVTYNKVFHRFCFFAISNFVLIGLWVLLFLPVIQDAGINL